MATNITAQSVLEKISEDHLECSICTNRFRQPKLLDCLHSFCLKCLKELTECQGTSGTKLTCPLCRCETILEGSGVADLPNNFAMSALVEEFAMQEKLLEGQGSEIKCQACNEENPAISRCMDCEYFLCQECQRAHERWAAMKSHKIYSLAQFQSGEIVYKSKLREEVPKCGKHPDQNLNVYCHSCEQVICTTCSVLGHAKHSLIGLDEALDKCKQNVEKLVETVEKNKTELSITMHETEMSRKKLDTMFSNAKKKINKKADEVISKTQEDQQNLLKETERIYEDRVTTFETAQAINCKEVTQAEHKLDEVKQLMAQASCYEILALQQKILHNLSELTGKQAEKVPDELAFLDFEEGERSLGKLILEEEAMSTVKQSPRSGRLCAKVTWELKTDHFGSREVWITQVAAFSNNKILVLDSNYPTNAALFTVSYPNSLHEPSPIPQRLQIKGLSNIRDITVSMDDKLIALDGKVVKVFNKQHQLLHQFTPGQRPNSKPTCLAVDDNNLIAVGYKGKKEISLHNPDGSLIRRLPAPKIWDYLTIYKQQLIYTNDKNKQLLSVDYHGARVFSVDMTSNMQEHGYPTGLCCDTDGSIYVAVSGNPSGDILHYTPDGEYIECTIRECGDPLGITFTSGGDLLVAALQSAKIYCRV